MPKQNQKLPHPEYQNSNDNTQACDQNGNCAPQPNYPSYNSQQGWHNHGGGGHSHNHDGHNHGGGGHSHNHDGHSHGGGGHSHNHGGASQGIGYRESKKIDEVLPGQEGRINLFIPQHLELTYKSKVDQIFKTIFNALSQLNACFAPSIKFPPINIDIGLCQEGDRDCPGGNTLAETGTRGDTQVIQMKAVSNFDNFLTTLKHEGKHAWDRATGGKLRTGTLCEGSADFTSEGPCSQEKINFLTAARSVPTFSEIFTDDHGGPFEKLYRWGYFATWFFAQKLTKDEYDQLTSLSSNEIIRKYAYLEPKFKEFMTNSPEFCRKNPHIKLEDVIAWEAKNSHSSSNHGNVQTVNTQVIPAISIPLNIPRLYGTPGFLATITAPFKITVYGSDGCGGCVDAKETLKKAGVIYSYTQSSAPKQACGGQSNYAYVPKIYINDICITGQQLDFLRQQNILNQIAFEQKKPVLIPSTTSSTTPALISDPTAHILSVYLNGKHRTLTGKEKIIISGASGGCTSCQTAKETFNKHNISFEHRFQKDWDPTKGTCDGNVYLSSPKIYFYRDDIEIVCLTGKDLNNWDKSGTLERFAQLAKNTHYTEVTKNTHSSSHHGNSHIDIRNSKPISITFNINEINKDRPYGTPRFNTTITAPFEITIQGHEKCSNCIKAKDILDKAEIKYSYTEDETPKLGCGGNSEFDLFPRIVINNVCITSDQLEALQKDTSDPLKRIALAQELASISIVPVPSDYPSISTLTVSLNGRERTLTGKENIRISGAGNECIACKIAKETFEEYGIPFKHDLQKNWDPTKGTCDGIEVFASPKIYIYRGEEEIACLTGEDLNEWKNNKTLKRFAELVKNHNTHTNTQTQQATQTTTKRPITAEFIISTESKDILDKDVLKPIQIQDQIQRKVLEASQYGLFMIWVKMQGQPLKTMHSWKTPDGQSFLQKLTTQTCSQLIWETIIREAGSENIHAIKNYLEPNCSTNKEIKMLLDYYSPKQEAYCHYSPLNEGVEQEDYCEERIQSDHGVSWGKTLAYQAGEGIAQGSLSAVSNILSQRLQCLAGLRTYPAWVKWLIPTLVSSFLQTSVSLIRLPILGDTVWDEHSEEEASDIKTILSTAATYFFSTLAAGIALRLALEKTRQWIDTHYKDNPRVKAVLTAFLPYLASFSNLPSLLLSRSTYTEVAKAATGFAVNLFARGTTENILSKLFNPLLPSAQGNNVNPDENQIEMQPVKHIKNVTHLPEHKNFQPSPDIRTHNRYQPLSQDNNVSPGSKTGTPANLFQQSNVAAIQATLLLQQKQPLISNARR
ncbi:MAG: hypothetical protein WAL30_01865 [Candidatus Aquirickettsiella sp.]